jgi:hypothetical protein
LVWTLRVTISPWNSPPDFLKEPMLAIWHCYRELQVQALSLN